MRGGLQLALGAAAFLCVAGPIAGHRCDRTPDGPASPRVPADGRFVLRVSGSPDTYVPSGEYTISLSGTRNQGQVQQKFTGFMIVVEPQHKGPLRALSPRDITPRDVGTFHLMGDTLTKFSPSCPNMVTHTSSIPKSDVSVRWTAPPPGSGCVVFRTTVIEHRDVWYQDDGPLSRVLCEEETEDHNRQPDPLPECCACDEAKYEVTFEGLWSRHTHPKDFPSNSWSTRFSDVIGASHSFNYRFWDYGGIASDGLAQVAEHGSTRLLESELKKEAPLTEVAEHGSSRMLESDELNQESQHIRTIIKARGISYPNITGKTFAVFRVDKIHHLMSLVSMIDPSPDWIVGVSALELCLANCSWVESKVLNLYPWDAGTDSGISYVSPDQRTEPREKIRRITQSYPSDPRSPFYDATGAEMKPLARLYINKQKLYEKTCEEEAPTMDVCQTSEWSEWGECSATCGPGKRYKQRHYLRPSAAARAPANCRTALTHSQFCNVGHCMPEANPPATLEPADPDCDVNEWGDWSRCTPSDSDCSKGKQTRYRRVQPRSRSKYCLKFRIKEDRDCTLSSSHSVCPRTPGTSTTDPVGEPDTSTNEPTENDPDFTTEDPDQSTGGLETNKENVGEPSGECSMTQWSEWSPCDSRCGQGMSTRERTPLFVSRRRRRHQILYDDYGERLDQEDLEFGPEPCSVYPVLQRIPCNGTDPSCNISSATDEGDQTTTEETATDDNFPVRNLVKQPYEAVEGTEKPVRHCKFSRWSEWSECDAPCGKQGFKERTRRIEVHARNGGKACSGKTRKQKKCVRRCQDDEKDEDGSGIRDDNKDCEYSEWSEWTQCTQTCGIKAVRQRTRRLLQGNPYECTGRLHKQRCKVGPCH